MKLRTMLMLPTSLSSFFEDACRERNVSVNCISSGCGTVEYEFKNKVHRNTAINRLTQEFIKTVTDGCFSVDEEGVPLTSKRTKRRNKRS